MKIVITFLITVMLFCFCIFGFYNIFRIAETNIDKTMYLCFISINLIGAMIGVFFLDKYFKL